MTLPTLADSEIIKIIGRRQNQTTYDCVAIIPAKVSFSIDNPVIAIPIPNVDSSVASDTKLINLKRIIRKIAISGSIWDGSDSHSATGVTLNDSTGAVSGGTSVTSVIKKKWILEEMAQGQGVGVTVQYRAIIIPTAETQTSPPTIPSDETKNVWHKLAIITGLAVDDDASTPTSPQSSYTKYFPEKMNVKMTLQWGSLQS